MLRLGAHLSVAGGMDRAVDRARALGATAMQVFVKSARRWVGRDLPEPEVESFRDALERDGLAAFTLAHATYLFNPASPDAEVRRRSIEGLGGELDRCARLGIPSLVVHPGAHLGSGEPAALRRVADSIDRVYSSRAGATAAERGRVRLLLETTAGQGTNVGHRFEHLAEILERCAARERLGVCFDTCHVHAAGYDLRDARSYLATFAAFDDAIGIGRLRAFHLNDSRFPLGSRRDRHAHIGKGEIGLEAFRRILRDRRFRDLPMVLETPKGAGGEDDSRNLATLRRVAASSGRRA